VMSLKIQTLEDLRPVARTDRCMKTLMNNVTMESD